MLTSQPELAATVYRALDDPRIEPEAIAGWLAGHAQNNVPPDCSGLEY